MNEKEVLGTMTGVWTSRISPRFEVNLACDSPYIKSVWSTQKIEILSIDATNLEVRYRVPNANNAEGTLRLSEQEKGQFLLVCAPDGGKPYVYGYVCDIPSDN
jgi:hypothetical protein